MISTPFKDIFRIIDFRCYFKAILMTAQSNELLQQIDLASEVLEQRVYEHVKRILKEHAGPHKNVDIDKFLEILFSEGKEL